MKGRKYISIPPLMIILTLMIINTPSMGMGAIKSDSTNNNSTRLESTSDAIRPYSKNPWYWELNGEPILLRGASDNDNLFQWTGQKLINQLERLDSAGGNYLRCTLSDRDEESVYAYDKVDDGMYDLTRWNETYWNRLEFFLNETEKRGMVVQLTLWDHFDLSSGNFKDHPLNPANNINLEEGIIEDGSDYYGGSVDDRNKKVLEIQRRFVNKVLSISFDYKHVLYNIENETSKSREWQNYWAAFLKEKAREKGRRIYITTMNLSPSTGVRHVMTYDSLFSYAEISQNNQDFAGARGAIHYKNVLRWRNLIQISPSGPMPMNNVKIYGGTGYAAGTAREAEERFWRNVFAGAASVRFHRSAGGVWGIGLNERATTNLKALSVFLEEFNIFTASPYPECKPVENNPAAYALATPGKQYAVYFPAGRYGVKFNPWVYAKKIRIRWLNIETAEWEQEKTVTLDWNIDEIERYHGFRNDKTLWTPGDDPYIAVIEVVK